MVAEVGQELAVRLLAPAVSDLRSCNLHPELCKLSEQAK